MPYVLPKIILRNNSNGFTFPKKKQIEHSTASEPPSTSSDSEQYDSRVSIEVLTDTSSESENGEDPQGVTNKFDDFNTKMKEVICR